MKVVTRSDTCLMCVEMQTWCESTQTWEKDSAREWQQEEKICDLFGKRKDFDEMNELYHASVIEE